MKHQLHLMAAGLLAAGLLAGCSDDDDVAVTPTPAAITEVPASAGASTTAYTKFGLDQSGMTSETSEPLGTDLVTTAPTSETEEPVTL